MRLLRSSLLERVLFCSHTFQIRGSSPQLVFGLGESFRKGSFPRNLRPPSLTGKQGGPLNSTWDNGTMEHMVATFLWGSIGNRVPGLFSEPDGRSYPPRPLVVFNWCVGSEFLKLEAQIRTDVWNLGGNE